MAARVGNRGPVRQLSVRPRSWSSISDDEYRDITAIWEGAFPAAERSAFDGVSCRNSTWLWTATSDDGGLIGFATAFLMPTAKVAYLEYLAVSPTLRGGGTGAKVLAAIADTLAADSSVEGIALEVEDPARTPGDDPVLPRRVAFYGRWGAHPIGCLRDYSMPDLADFGRTLPMLLLWRPLGGGGDLDGLGTARLLTDLYRGYYAHAAADGHLEEMIGRISRAT